MKKHIVTLLCTAALLLGAASSYALAADGPYYPISVEEYTAEGSEEPRIKKVYQLSLSDDPSGIPRSDFEQNGRRYYLLDMVKEYGVGVDTRDCTEAVTQDSDTKDLSAILKQLDAHIEVTTEDGYTGLLALDYPSVTVEAKGYKTVTRSLSATRSYPSLCVADLSLVPKSITDGGKTLTLEDVKWSSDEGGYYTATATYSGTSNTRCAIGYTVTANYTVQVAKTECKVVIYTAIFGSEELPAEVPPIEMPAQPDEPVQDVPEIDWLSILGCAGGVAGLAAVGWRIVEKWKGRKKKRI